jgi:hypothetical protein
LVATDHESAEEAGLRVAEFPLGELKKEGQTALRREVVFLDGSGAERPASAEEENEVFDAISRRMGEITERQTAPCPRCGRRVAEHPDPFPVRLMADGPISFGCWTDEEKSGLDPGFREALE